MTAVIHEDRVCHALEEDACETCGHLLRVGDHRFWHGRTGATYCSLECLIGRNLVQEAWKECDARYRARLVAQAYRPKEVWTPVTGATYKQEMLF